MAMLIENKKAKNVQWFYIVQGLLLYNSILVFFIEEKKSISESDTFIVQQK